MSEWLLNIFTFCLAIIITFVVLRFLLRLLRGLVSLVTFLHQDRQPHVDMVDRFHGKITDAHNWHSKGGDFHAEFWFKNHDNVEKRYKLTNVHPELRQGHQVTLYEYAGTLVAIINHSTGQEAWVAPNHLLSRLYPSGKKSTIIRTLLLFIVMYYGLQFVHQPWYDLLLFLMFIGFGSYLGWMSLRYLLSSSSRRHNRLDKLAMLCQQKSS